MKKYNTYQFLPTPSHGGRRLFPGFITDSYRFLPTPSHGGRRGTRRRAGFPDLFLPTPSHGGRHAHFALNRHWYPISTHALTWRATFSVSICQQPIKPFLPTPSHGGRPSALRCAATIGKFLPTPSHGGRPFRARQDQQETPISTHALTWRATATPKKARPRSPLFLPTPSHGGRLFREVNEIDGQRDFYPRPHMEGD